MVAGSSALLLALSLGGSAGYAWDSAKIIALLAGAAVLTAAFIFAESRAQEPILPLRLFKLPTFSLANAGTFILGFAMFGSIIYVPLYLQIVKGATPTRSGLLMLPMMAGVIVTSIVAGRAISKLGRYKWFPVAGTVIMGTGLLLFTSLEVNTPLWQAFIYMTVIGVGLGLAMQPLILAVQNSLELRDMGAGTSAATFFRSLGGSVGVAALGAVMTNQLAKQMTGAASGVSINAPSQVRSLPPAQLAFVEHVFVTALHPVFLSAAVVALLGTLVTILLPNKSLQGGTPATATEGSTEVSAAEAEEKAAAEMEAKVGAF